jgi:hypothetical protein
MRNFFTCSVILLVASIAFSQQGSPPQTGTPTSDVQNYASYGIALFPPTSNAEVILPFLTTENKIAFFPLSTVQQAVKEKRLLGRPISYGEVVSLIGQFQIENDRLKQENDKLWAIVGKSSTAQNAGVQGPSPAVQAAAADAQRAALAQADAQRLQEQRRAAILRFLMGQQTQRINMNVNVTDCTKLPALCVNH